MTSACSTRVHLWLASILLVALPPHHTGLGDDVKWGTHTSTVPGWGSPPVSVFREFHFSFPAQCSLWSAQ